MLNLNIILLHIGHSSDLIQPHYLPLISIALSARFESATQTPVFQIYTFHNLFFMLNLSIKKPFILKSSLSFGDLNTGGKRLDTFR